MKLRRYPTGWSLIAGTHRFDYWTPRSWVPLGLRERERRHWWGWLTHVRVSAAPAPEEPTE